MNLEGGRPMTRTLEKETDRIAKAIVDLVERTNGPVTFARIEREVPGFAATGSVRCNFFLAERPENPALVVWDGMTESGCIALNQVMIEKRVAVQYVTTVLYEDRLLD